LPSTDRSAMFSTAQQHTLIGWHILQLCPDWALFSYVAMCACSLLSNPANAQKIHGRQPLRTECLAPSEVEILDVLRGTKKWQLLPPVSGEGFPAQYLALKRNGIANGGSDVATKAVVGVNALQG
jgi:hypothetical protein